MHLCSGEGKLLRSEEHQFIIIMAVFFGDLFEIMTALLVADLDRDYSRQPEDPKDTLELHSAYVRWRLST